MLLEENSVDVERLRFEELTPTRSGAMWRGIEPGSFEDVAHGAGRYPKAGSGQFTADALIAP
ncbi:hypothetical protein AB0K16_40455 [Nonomuraea jabiensis]|uniref:hypothetical protein n=1 Tax=Nonomuraea jabiensis TaxID=882448 RepID=UPI0034308255